MTESQVRTDNTETLHNALKRIAELEYKLSEISKRFEPQAFVEVMNEVEENFCNKQNLNKAKEIIQDLLNWFIYPLERYAGLDGEDKLHIKQAEQFLEVEE